jgi:signal transduction histidine kinase
MAASSQGLVPWVFGIGLLISLTLCGITVALARTHRDLHLAQVQLKEHAQNLEKAVAARTARLRETVAELERMSYSIVHDLRAPLRAIQSFAGILEEEAGTTLTADCRGYLARMKTAASRMDALIRDVLNYGKLVKEELPLTPIDLNRLLSGILETYPAFQKDSADITLAPDLPVVLANEAALTQCFSNLLDNAVKFVKPGQKPRVHVSAEPPPLHHSITPSLHHSPLPAQPQGRFVRICVADQGIGIPPELHSKVFGMFERLDTSHEGTGMGLTIVRKATERMGGKVSLFSEPGHGTRVCIDLRLVD